MRKTPPINIFQPSSPPQPPKAGENNDTTKSPPSSPTQSPLQQESDRNAVDQIDSSPPHLATQLARQRPAAVSLSSPRILAASAASPVMPDDSTIPSRSADSTTQVNDSNIPAILEAMQKHYIAGKYSSAATLIKALLKFCDKAINEGKYSKIEYQCFTTLGDIYIEKGLEKDVEKKVGKKDLQDYPKAAALYQYANQLAKNFSLTNIIDIDNQLTNMEQKFLSSVDAVASYDREIVKKCKDELKAFRELIASWLSKIQDFVVKNNQLDQENLLKRAGIIKNIYLDIRKFFIGQEAGNQGLLIKLIAQAKTILGPVPPNAEYAIIGLGSMALGTMTPWSDVEFAILIQNELGKTNKKDVIDYFYKLTTLLHISIINLGETELAAMAIKELNDFEPQGVNNLNKKKAFPELLQRLHKHVNDLHSADVQALENANKALTDFGSRGIAEVDHKEAFSKSIQRLRDAFVALDPELASMATKQIDDFISEDWFWDKLMPKGISFDAQRPIGCKTPLGRKGFTGYQDYGLICTPEELAHYQDEEGCPEHTLQQLLLNTILIEGSNNSNTLLDAYNRLIKRKLEQQEKNKLLRIQNKSLDILKKDAATYDPFKIIHDLEGKLFDVKKEIYRYPDRVFVAISSYSNKYNLTQWEALKEIISSNGCNIDEETKKSMMIAFSIACELRLRTYCNNAGQHGQFSALQYINPTNDGTKESIHYFKLRNIEILRIFFYITTMLDSEISEYFNSGQQRSMDLTKISLNKTSSTIKGLVCMRLMEYDKALKHLKQAKDMIEKNTSVGHTEEMIIILNSLGIGSGNLGNYSTSIQYLQDANNKCIEKFDANSLITAKILNGLGNAYGKNGQHMQAILHHKEALRIYKFHNKDSIEFATVYTNLGRTNWEMDPYVLHDKVTKYFKKALAIKIQKFGKEHPSVAITLFNLGAVYVATQKYDLAIQCYEQALAIKENVFGKEHPDTRQTAEYLQQTLQREKIIKLQISTAQGVTKMLSEITQINFQTGISKDGNSIDAFYILHNANDPAQYAQRLSKKLTLPFSFIRLENSESYIILKNVYRPEISNRVIQILQANIKALEADL